MLEFNDTQINGLIATAFSLGYTTRRTVVTEKQSEADRTEFAEITMAAAMQAFHCPTVADESFCTGCVECFPPDKEEPESE